MTEGLQGTLPCVLVSVSRVRKHSVDEEGLWRSGPGSKSPGRLPCAALWIVSGSGWLRIQGGG